MERDYLYLRGNESLAEVIEAIRACSGTEVILSVPAGFLLFDHPINLELLQTESRQRRRKLLVSSDDPIIAKKAKEAGFEIFLDETAKQSLDQKVVADIRRPASAASASRAAGPAQPPSVQAAAKAPSETVLAIKGGQTVKQVSEGVKTPSRTQIKEPAHPGSLSMPVSEEEEEGRGLKWVAIVGVVGVFVVLIGVLYALGTFVFAKAQITLVPQVVAKEFRQSITIDASAIKNDSKQSILAGQVVTLEKTLTKTYPATGAAGGGSRARAMVTVANEGDRPLTLIPTTRFVATAGQIFRTVARVTIEAAQAGKAETAQVEVIADGVGAKYNLPADTTFTIPGLAGSYFDGKVRAVLPQPIRGGQNGATKVVTVEDIIQGKKDLESKLRDLPAEEFRLRHPSSHIFSEAVLTTVNIADSSVKPEQVAEEVALTGEVKATAIVVERQQLENFLKDMQSAQLVPGTTLKRLEITGSKVVRVDFEKKITEVEVSGRASLEPQLEESRIRESVVGKGTQEVESYIRGLQGVKEGKIHVWPFWLNRLPKNPEKVQIIIQERQGGNGT